MGLKTRDVLWIRVAALREKATYLATAAPAMVSYVADNWFWEVCALVISYLGDTALAAHVAALSFVVLAITPAVGISSASATLTGNALGANFPRKAKWTALACVGLNHIV